MPANTSSLLKAIIIDDESSSRETLKVMLSKYCPTVQLVESISSIKEAVPLIQEHKPRIVFLDIEMPQENGFKLFDYVPNPDFEVIFTTAFDKYALKAIKFAALDFLLKPIDLEELQAAIKKVDQRPKSTNNRQQIRVLQENLNQQFHKIALPTLEGFIFIKLNEIIRLESEGNYTTFYLKDTKPQIVSKPIKEFEQLLEDFNFQRVHRSHILNLNYIRQFHRGKHPKIITVDKAEITLSPIRKDAFLQKFLKL